jgi:hypothetical protein
LDRSIADFIVKINYPDGGAIMNKNMMRSTVAVLLIVAFGVSSCRPQGPAPVVTVDNSTTVQNGQAARGSASSTSTAPAVPAPVVTQASWAPDALEELLAPIALYPDQLLGQILAASINSQEVLDGGNWLLENQNLSGKDLDAAAEKAGFGPAMRALMQFPTVVDMMCQEIDWTRQVGAAFSTDQKNVLDAVQRLRKEAADVGNLKSTPQQTVAAKTEGGNVYIEVKPADPQIVYVPQYDPQAVYTTPPPQAAPAATTAAATTATTTTKTEETKKDDGVSTGAAVAIGLIGFAAGVAVGSAMHDDYYYPHWGVGVYYGPRPFYPPAYVYRPVYGPAFRPAYGYRPPAGYRYNYNNVRGNNNIVINNNNNYYNRFNNNQNLRSGGTRSPLAPSQQPRTGQARAGQTARPATTPSWKGQSTYAGTRDSRTGNSAVARPNANTRDTQVANRASARPADTASRIDRGYGDAGRAADYGANARPENRQVNTASDPARAANRQVSTASDPARAANRQVSTTSDSARAANRQADASPNVARPASSDVNTSAAARPASSSASRTTPARESAFSGAQAQGSGNFQRSASARGNASAGSRRTSGGRTGRR